MLWPLLSLLAAAQAAEAVQTPVLAHVVDRGDIISSGDFAVEARSPGQARGAVAPEDANGKEAARRLSAGAVVRANDIMTPRLVRRGEPVTIHVRSAGLVITTAGKALGDGAKGDLVRVVANSTSRTLDAIVEGSGAVRIATP